MINISPENIAKAVEILRAGGLVSFPTETVYGLGADANNEAAIRKVFQAKKRPYDHPLIVHLASVRQLPVWALEVPSMATALAEAFWPGPLTLILKKQPHVLNSVTGGQDTIGLRIPRHPIAQALLKAFGGGVAAPSANQFTHISPTTATAVHEELGKAVDLVLDGGACEVGLESTVLDVTGEKPVILRPGMITAEDIERILGVRPIILNGHADDSTRAPGMHHIHYAPVTTTISLASDQIESYLQTLKPADLPVVVVAHSERAVPHRDHIHYVKMPHEAVTYAHDLYRTLRALDNEHFKQIIIEAVPAGAEWLAIRDRLFKACRSRQDGI